MIKSIHEITLKDVILLNEIKSAKHLKTYWFIPMLFLRSKFEKLASEIFKKLGNKTLDDISVDVHKLVSYRNLMILEALYKAANIELNLKLQINIYKILLDKEPIQSKLLLEVVEQIKKYTGIEIKTPDDFKAFEDYIQWKTDKYKESYPPPDPNKKKDYAKLTRIIYGIFKYMDEPYNESMRLMAFIEMKEMAEERYRKQLQKEHDGKQQ